MGHPVVSIITVTFNAADALKDTILSVVDLKRIYPKIELIVIDGGSSDATRDILEEYTGQIKYWVSEPDHGIYDAMNKGWLVADPDSVIVFLGAGDKISQLPLFTDNSTDKVIYGSVQLQGNGLFRSKVGLKTKLCNTLHHQALLVPKNLHPLPPFDTQFKVYADFDFNQRLIKSGAVFLSDRRFLASAKPGGISSRFHKKEMCAIVKKNHGVFFYLCARVLLH